MSCGVQAILNYRPGADRQVQAKFGGVCHGDPPEPVAFLPQSLNSTHQPTSMGSKLLSKRQSLPVNKARVWGLGRRLL